MIRLTIILILSTYAHTTIWDHNVYGLCNYSDKAVGYYAYDNTLLAAANANQDPYTKGEWGGVDGTYIHIYNCHNKGCFARNNQRVYQQTGDIPYKGLLAAFWTDDSLDEQPIRACGRGVGDIIAGFAWNEANDDCYLVGRFDHHAINSQLLSFVIVVTPDAKIEFRYGTDVNRNCGPYPKPTPKKCDQIEKPDGRWIHISSNPFNQKVTISKSTTHAYTHTTGENWGAKVTTAVSSGFTTGSQGVSAQISVSGEVSESFSKSYSDTFSQTESETFEFQFPGGVVWQFQFKIKDDCGTSVSKARDMQVTGS